MAETHHSPEYLKRRAERERDIAYWRERAGWTDAQFLAEYAENQRREAIGQAEWAERHQREDTDIEEIVRETGTDEG